MPTAAMSVHRKRSWPWPKGWSGVGCSAPRLSDTRRKAWLTVSAIECAVSASIALEPVIRPAASFATAIVPLAASAMLTVRRLAASALASGTLRRLIWAAVDTVWVLPVAWICHHAALLHITSRVPGAHGDRERGTQCPACPGGGESPPA